MIADEIGVTKAAVYHQYRTKDEIVIAVAMAELARLEAAVEQGESEPTPERGRDVTLDGIVDLAIERRREAGSILDDPVIVGYFADDDTFRSTMHRLRLLLAGDDRSPEARIRTAMLLAAVSGATMHPFVVDLDDDVLRPELRRLARSFLGLPD
jgi:AcrR family transcriptional regulator